MPTETTTYAEWLSGRTESGRDRPLTDEEQLWFDRWYREHAATARRVARRFVGSRQVDDVVHGAITRILRAIVTDDPESPRDYDGFRQRMQHIVYFLARNVTGRKPYTPPAHSRWGETQAPISGRKVPERLLARDFESISVETVDAVDAKVAYPLLPSAAYRGPWELQLDPVRRVRELEFIISGSLCDLPEMQAAAVIAWLDQTSRKLMSLELCVSLKTFDTHFARAKRKLREILLAADCKVPDVFGELNGSYHVSVWREMFRDMELDRQDREHAKRSRAKRLMPAAETRKAA